MLREWVWVRETEREQKRAGAVRTRGSRTGPSAVARLRSLRGT